jgi:hypothetical protein
MRTRRRTIGALGALGIALVLAWLVLAPVRPSRPTARFLGYEQSGDGILRASFTFTNQSRRLICCIARAEPKAVEGGTWAGAYILLPAKGTASTALAIAQPDSSWQLTLSCWRQPILPSKWWTDLRRACRLLRNFAAGRYDTRWFGSAGLAPHCDFEVRSSTIPASSYLSSQPRREDPAPNKAPPADGGTPVLFHIGRPRPATAEAHRYSPTE